MSLHGSWWPARGPAAVNSTVSLQWLSNILAPSPKETPSRRQRLRKELQAGTLSESDQGNRRTVDQDNRWDGGFLGSLSDVAQEPRISQQLSWPRTVGDRKRLVQSSAPSHPTRKGARRHGLEDRLSGGLVRQDDKGGNHLLRRGATVVAIPDRAVADLFARHAPIRRVSPGPRTRSPSSTTSPSLTLPSAGRHRALACSVEATTALRCQTCP